LFADAMPNAPFGGQGWDSSLIATVLHVPGRGVFVSQAHYPTLLSEEAFMAFGKPNIEVKPPLKSRDEYTSALAALIEQAKQAPESIHGLIPAWQMLKAPQREVRRTGLKAMQEVIAREGLYQVIAGPRPPP